MHPLLKARLSLRWLYRLGLGCCLAVALFFIYALSFGPALKLVGRKPRSGQMLPKWVFVAYGPLFMVQARMPPAVESAYERYLDLWCPEPTHAPDEKE
jgi:hypothetical protein